MSARSPDDDPFDPLERSVPASCPYCGEDVELLVDPGGGPVQRYVEDCEVCCRPWQVVLRIGRTGAVDVELTTLDDT